jgi:hypothetical protein
MLTFEDIAGTQEQTVRLDKKIVGKIKHVTDGFQYFPKGSKTGGAVFSNRRHCQLSLHTPEELEAMGIS